MRVFPAIAATALAFGAALPSLAQSDPSAGTVKSGISEGTAWSVQIPPSWNGTLLIYSHGGAPGPEQPLTLAPPGSAALLLGRGYALAGTVYTKAGWNPLTGALGQFAALPAIQAALGRKADHVINVGTSYGGLVAVTEVDHSNGDIDGSVATCGLIVGGVDLMNAQLDAAHAVNQLLTADHSLPLVHLGDQAGASASGAALTNAIVAATGTPVGRARVALAAALMHVPGWHDGQKPAAADRDSQAVQQLEWLTKGIGHGGGLFDFEQGSRFDIETQAGGNPSWNKGVDYAALLQRNEYLGIVQSLYRKAHLDLAADLKTLTRTASIAADPHALEWMKQTSVPGGHLRVPVLAMQTSGDPVAPRSFLVAYAERAQAAGTGDLLRTALVERPGHCSFQPAEILAAVDAMKSRLERGSWGDLAKPSALELAAGPAAGFVAPPTAPFIAHQDQD